MTIYGNACLVSASKVEVLRPRQSKARTTVNGKVPPARRLNAAVGPREYLLPDEVEAVVKAAKGLGHHGQRDYTLVLIAFRHGLRVAEMVALRWDMVDLKRGLLHVTRLKNGVASTHPLRGPELRALRQLKRDYPPSPYLFVTERGGPITASAVRKVVARAGQTAGIGFPIHPHMLRHACGYKLANDGHDTRALHHYLGHRNIQHTTRYTQLSPDSFRTF